MTDATPSTPSLDDNLLGLTDKIEIDAKEAEGFLRAERALLELSADEDYDNGTLLRLHRLALGELYEWAGQYRRTTPLVGIYQPPQAGQVGRLMAEFQFELNQRFALVEEAGTEEELVRFLAWCHHRLVWIHPFTNGNGRTARLLSNWQALRFGFAPLQLYAREAGDLRQQYIRAVRQYDQHQSDALETMVRRGLRPISDLSGTPTSTTGPAF